MPKGLILPISFQRSMYVLIVEFAFKCKKKIKNEDKSFKEKKAFCNLFYIKIFFLAHHLCHFTENST